MIYNLDVCHAVVECTPAPKATKDMRKRKLANRRFEQWCRPGWVTLACMADPFTVCIVAVMVTISNLRNQQEWTRNKDTHPITKQYIYCDTLHCKNVDGTYTRCKPRVVESVEHCNARNVYTYLHTVLFILCHWPIATAAVIAMRLLLSGDIELNPGPLTTGDMKKICDSIWDARTKWYHIGIQLDIDTSVLDTIKHDNDDVGLRLTAMLTGWLKQTTPSPTWQALVHALKSPMVGCRHLAESIEKKYCDRATLQSDSQSANPLGAFSPQQHTEYQPTFSQYLLPQLPHGGYQPILAQYPLPQLPYSSYQPTFAHYLPPQRPHGGYQPTPAQYPLLQQPHGGYQQLFAQYPLPQHPHGAPSQLLQEDAQTQEVGQQGEHAHPNEHSGSTSPPTSEKPPFGCGCGKCTFFSFLERGCPKAIPSASSLPYLDLSRLTHEQQQELRGRLCFESQQMMMKFQKLVSATILSFEQQQIPLHKLRSHVMTLGAFSPMHEGPQRPALDNHFKDLQTANTVSEIFWLLRDNLSFFNYHILEHMITVLGTEEDNDNLRRYMKQFEQYAKRRMYECLPQFGPICETGYADVFVKVDSHYEMYTVIEVEILRCQFSEILHVSSQGVLRLCRVEKGCFQLTFQVPSFVQQAIFPLSSQQERALEEKGVIRLMCGKYQFTRKECQHLHHKSSKEETSDDDGSDERQRRDIADTDATGQSFAAVPDASELNSTPQAGQSVADATDDSEASSTPLDVYAKNLKSRYRCRPKRKNIWPPQTTKKYFNLALIKEETVRKGEISDEFTRLTITGKVEDILRSKLPIKLEDVFKKTDDHQKMTILMEGCPGSGKTALTQHLCLEWVHGKLFQDYKLVILVRLREPAIHNAKDIKEILPRVGTEENIAKEIESSCGRGVLFILDGWDELPEDVSGHDTIYNIISGETLPECDSVITSRPTSSASLHDTELISSRIEILGFTPGELCEFFTEHLEGNASKANTLLHKIEANPIVAGTCALPLNAVILVHIFKQHGDLPTTEHGIFEALIRNCILRHVKERTELKIRVIKSLTNLPQEVKLHYHALCKIAYNGVMEDQVIFELSEDFNTLGLLQGVECYSSYGTEYFYNFLHLSIQEFLAAQHIATFKPAKQVAEFDGLFGQARFSSTFRHYSAITKLAITGIDEIVLRIVKRCASDSSDDEDKAHLLSLLNCLREAEEPPMYNLMADNLGSKLDLQDITLNLADCLSISYFLKYVTDINLDSCSIEADGIRMLFSQDQVYQIRALDLSRNEIGAEEAKALLAAMEKMVTLQELVLYNCGIGAEEIKLLSTGMEKMVHLQKLNLRSNQLGLEGAVVAMEMIHLQELYLSYNVLSDEGVETAMEKMVHFQELELSGGEREAARAKPAMKKLYLIQCGIGDGGMKLLSTCMKKMVNLQELYLSYNSLGDDGIVALSTTLAKLVHLQKLYLFSNQIGDRGCTALGAALEQCRELQVLDLMSNRLTDSSVESLCELIKTAKCLKELYIEGNEIQDEGATALTDALRMKGNQSLNTPNQNVQTQQPETDHSEPKFPSTKWKSLMKEISPAILDIQQADKTTKNAVQLFAKQVVLILHTCNQSEYWAALERLKPPTREDDGEIKDRPIQYSQDGSVMGWFAGYRAAVVRTEQGNKGRDVLTKALTKSFPNGQVIIGTGIAYANDQKFNLADVLISEQYTVSGGAITNHDSHQQIDPNVMKVFKDPANDWSAKKCFTCGNDNRTSVAHIGHIVSVSSLEILRERLSLAPNSIGGEIEGWVLFELKKVLKVQNEKDIEIIIIHGVSEYHNLTMGDKWQWTAAKAAIDCIHYCLTESGGTKFNAMNIAKEEAREQHYKAYQQALKDETAIPLKYLKVLFFGPPRTGKTSMRRRLVGEIQNFAKEPVQVSTGTAEHYDVIVKEDKNTTSTTVITEKSNWLSIKVLCGKEKNTHLLDEELRLLYQCISETQNKSHHIQTGKPSDENSSPVSPNENSPPKGNESLNENKSPVRDEQQSPVKDKENVSRTKTTESNSNTSASWVTPVREQEHEHSAKYIEREEIDKEFEAFDQFLHESGEGQNKDLLEGTILMNMVDTGGQPAFLEMLPALTMGPALYLIFFRLNQELKQTYEIQYVSKDNEEVPLGGSSYTVEDVIFQALSSIACFSCASPKKDNMPVPSHAAVLVGTHKDKLESDTDAKVKAKDDVLRKNLNKILKCDFRKIDKIIVHSFSSEQLVFAVDNVTGGKAELASVRKRLQQIIEQMFKDGKFDIPASWLMFSIFLRKMGKSIMSLSQCHMIGERLNVSDTGEALWFLHHCVGVLMHFPEVNNIKDIVICNPQIVFDGVTNLILDSFRIESVCDSIHNKFKETGQFRFEDIQKIPESTGDSLPLPKLVKLLEYLNIISPITPEDSSPQSDVYFMPAVLRYAKKDELSMKQSTTDPLPPLMIHFKCGFVPVGVFCAKIASLVSQGWKLHNKSGHILCKNRATFRIFDGTYDITLISIPKWFEVHIACIASPDKPLHEICQVVLQTVCNTLDQVISKMNYGQVFGSDETPYELGFKCPEHLNDYHLAINKPRDGVEAPPQSSKSLWLWLNYHKGKSVMKCHNEDMKVDLDDQSLVWFGKGISVNITRHPEDQSVSTGENIDFHIEATGNDVLQFQWQKDGKIIDNHDPRFFCKNTDCASTLHISCVKKHDEGYYKCLVTEYAFEKSGKASSEAKLTVCDPLHMTQNPENKSVTSGKPSHKAGLTDCLELNVKNVRNVLHEARFADAHWAELGLQLIDHFELATVQANHRDTYLCMIDTLSQWLKSDSKASWEKLAEVLPKVGGYGEATASIVREKAGILHASGTAATPKKNRVSSHPTPTSTVDRQTVTLKAELLHPQPPSSPASTTVDILDVQSESSNVDLSYPTAAEENTAEEPQILTIDDLLEVADYLSGLEQTDIYNLGLILGLNQPHVKKMRDSDTFSDDMIAAWLQKEDQVLKRGMPTWETLVNALRHHRVKQTKVAEKIEAEKLNVTQM